MHRARAFGNDLARGRDLELCRQQPCVVGDGAARAQGDREDEKVQSHAAESSAERSVNAG